MPKEVSKKVDLTRASEIYQVATYYAKGKSQTWIQTQMDLHPEKVKRDIRKAPQKFVESEDARRQRGDQIAEETETSVVHACP